MTFGFFLSASYSNNPNDFLSTDNNLFSSENDSDSPETKENGTQAPQTSAASKQISTGVGVVGGGGLFDDEEEDDFFAGKNQKTSDPGRFVGMFILVPQSTVV